MCSEKPCANQPKGFLVDAEITLAESSQWAADEIEAGATATAIHAPKIHHFVVYGETSPDDAAAFAAAKVSLGSAIDGPPHASYGRGDEADPPRAKMDKRHRHYSVRRLTIGQIAGHGVDFNPNFCDTEGTNPRFELMLHLVPQQSGSMPAAVRDKEAPGCSILNVAAVSRSIVHCIRTRR
jgi:hypothetical protein